MATFEASSSSPLISAGAARVMAETQTELDCLIEALLPEGARSPAAKGGEPTQLYLIVSSKDRLTQKYGEPGFNQLNDDLNELRRAIEGQADLQSTTVYVDDGPSLLRYGLQSADPTNPWQIKRLVDDLEVHLKERGTEIRYLLIVGGDSVIPFHRLPNPADDQDMDVPSDNPYASRDSNYLVPERAVGRMPDGEGGDIALLRTLIRTAIAGHRKPAPKRRLWPPCLAALLSRDSARRNGHSLGYSASVWRRASRAVFEIIGDNHQLRTCPPVTCQEFELAGQLRFGYFNLHGIEDGPNWYGQRDPLFPADYPLFPVALRPGDLSAPYDAGLVVFSEACYGANVLSKDGDDSIALRFLGLEALALAGSTKISYGSVAPPLLGADLLGRYFWEGLRARLTVGEALKFAKVNLARRMQERQGYLDGEDQKTLVSFVLYGDPSLPVASSPAESGSGLSLASFCPSIICQKRSKLQKDLVADELVAQVKKRVESSLPHMVQAQVRAAPLRPCNGGCEHGCSLGHGTVKVARRDARTWALALEKDIPAEDGGAHRQVVRVTVNEKGHILKLVISK
jgi:hypothetical protein